MPLPPPPSRVLGLSADMAALHGHPVLVAETFVDPARYSGVLTAWLTLDVQDPLHVLEAYLAFAFRDAGLNVLDGFEDRSTADGLFENRIGVLLRAIARHETPCVLALAMNAWITA